MPVFRRILKDGELSKPDQVSENIRLACGFSKEDWDFQYNGILLEKGFLNGLAIGLGGINIKEK